MHAFNVSVIQHRRGALGFSAGGLCSSGLRGASHPLLAQGAWALHPRSACTAPARTRWVC